MRLALAAGWMLQALSWGYALAHVRRAAAGAGEWGREGVIRLGMLLLVGAALWSPAGRIAALTPGLTLACLGVFWVGQITAVAARAQLGVAWGVGVLPRSARPVRTGIYATIPHPIYTGTLLALAAQLVLLQNLPASALLASGVIVVFFKIRAESARLGDGAGP